MRLRTITLILVGGLILLFVGGCGGGSSKSSTGSQQAPLSKGDYVKEMKTISADLSASINGLGSVTDAKSAAHELENLQVDLRKTADQLQSIHPPAGAKAAHQTLTSAVSDFANQLDPLINRLKAGDMTALTEVASLAAFKKLQAANEQLSKAGYKITS